MTAKRELRTAKLLVYQDNPGEGFQPEIFKRFYWWEPECVDRLAEKCGVTVVKKSFKTLAEEAKAIQDAGAAAAWGGRAPWGAGVCCCSGGNTSIFTGRRSGRGATKFALLSWLLLGVGTSLVYRLIITHRPM